MSEYTSASIIKSMKLFFIDNQGSWPRKAELVGDLVMWPDEGRYPTSVPIAVATHPNYEGRIVVQAIARGLLMTFVPGATNEEEARAAFNKKSGVVLESYRIAIDALVHRMVKHFVEDAEGKVTSEVDPLSLMAWMASSEKGMTSARIIASALHKLMIDHPGVIRGMTTDLQKDDPKADAFTMCDGLLTTIQQTLAARVAQAAAAPVQRRQ